MASTVYVSGNLTTVADLTEINIPKDTTKFSWVHLVGDYTEIRNVLAGQTKLNDNSIDALCQDTVRPRVFVNSHEDILLTLRSLSFNELTEMESFSIRIWIDQNLILTICKYDAISPFDLLKLISQPANVTASKFLSVLCTCLNEKINLAIEALDENIDEFEERTLNNQDIDLQQLQMLRTKILHLRRFLHPQKLALQKLTSSATSETELVEFRSSIWREIENSQSRDIEVLTELKERAVLLYESIQQKAQEKMNKVMFVLSVVASFFLPLSFIAGVLGMNVSGLPATSGEYGFYWVSLAMILFITIQWLIFRKWKWIS